MKRYLVGLALVALVGTLSSAPAVRAQDVGGGETAAPKNVTITLQDVDIKDAIRLILQDRAQVRIDPDVKGTVTATIKNLPVELALAQVLNNTGYTAQNDNGVYHIFAKVTAPTTPGGGQYNPNTPYNPTPTYNPNPAGNPMTVPSSPYALPLVQPTYPGYSPNPAYPTTGGFPGGPGMTAPAVPGGGAPAAAAADATPTVPVTLQKPIRMLHTIPEYVIALLRWLGSGSAGGGTGGTGTVGNGSMYPGGGQGQAGIQGYGANGGQQGGLNLPPTESSILAMEVMQGAQQTQAVGQIAQNGNGSNGQLGGLGGQSGGYGQSQGGYGQGQYGSSGGYGQNQGGYGQSQYGGSSGGYGQSQYGGGGSSGGYPSTGYRPY